ncbi:MAG: rRNA maturation RNase YbeY [Anaerolineaceae bacterium]|jgi:probable rRNA maturation factor
MINLKVSPAYKAKVDTDLLVKTAQYAIDCVLGLMVDVSIAIVSDRKIQQLNKRFRRIDAPTDVLSFSSDAVDPITDVPYLGDIVISLPSAQRNALNSGHPLMDEMQLLIVHGILHLDGYDHDTKKNKDSMWKLQEKILTNLGIHVEV